MATIEGVRQRARQGGLIRTKIYKAIGEDPNNNNQKADSLAKTLCDELDRTCKTVPEYQNGLMILGVNLSSLGKKALNISPASRLLQPDCVNHNDQQDLEADVEERKVQDEFGASEVCDVCGLPRTLDKMNINRLGVEDEHFGNQFENVQNDICNCKASAEDERLKNETEEERSARLERERKQKSEFLKASSVMKLWEEQHNAVLEQEEAREKMRAEKFRRALEENLPNQQQQQNGNDDDNNSNLLPERRGRK